MLLVACLIPSRWWNTSALLLLVYYRRACTSSPSESFCCGGLCLNGFLLHVWQAWSGSMAAQDRCYLLCSVFCHVPSTWSGV